MEVNVRSAGGAGTTALINYLSFYKKINDACDHDGIKYRRNLDLVKWQKQIIILSDPEDIYRSLSRRSYLNLNSLKLGFLNYFIRFEALFLYECRQLQLKWLSEWDSEESTIIIYYKDLFESADKIQQHLCITDNNFVPHFPKRRKRGNQQ